MVMLTLLACAPQVLSPSLDVRGLDGLSELPPDATVVGGGDLAMLFSHPLADEFGLVDIFDEQLGQAGLGISTRELDRAVVGCGTGGCVGVVDGDLSAAPRMPHVPEFRASILGDTVLLDSGRGPGLRARVAAGRARIADAPAWDSSGFDIETLVDAIPDGDAFLYAHDAPRFFEQAAQRAEAEGTGHSRKAAARARDMVPRARSAGLRAIAVSLDVSGEDESTLRVRYVADSPTVAVLWQGVIEAQGGLLNGTAADVWERGEWVRVGETVELSLSATANELRAIRNGQ